MLSPGGHSYWIPKVSDRIRPYMWAQYPSYDHVKAMYFYYAVQAGFDVRKSTQKKVDGVVTLKYFVCNRAGDPNVAPQDTLDPKCRIEKRTDMQRCGCEAGIKCRIIPESLVFEIYDVEERHNHPLYTNDNKHLSKTKRRLDFMQKSFIFNMSSQNVGPTKSHRLFCGLQGGYFYRGGTVVDFKNFSRDLNWHIGGSDAKFLVTKMLGRMKHVPNFSFEFKCNNKKLDALFWADETAKLHYKEFGDIISFDATFRTNR